MDRWVDGGPRLLALAALAALALGPAAVGCDGGGDGDADADSDGDGDADGDGGGPCGEVDEACCTSSPACVGELICAAVSGDEGRCLAACTPSRCSTDDARDGICTDVSRGAGVGVCIYVDPATSTCDTSSTDPCTTEYGAEGLCVAAQSGEAYCLEECAPETTGCDEDHECGPLVDPEPGEAEGVCVPTSSP